MANWDANKLEEDIKKSEQDNTDPPVPVPTPRKLTRQDIIRRYDRG